MADIQASRTPYAQRHSMKAEPPTPGSLELRVADIAAWGEGFDGIRQQFDMAGSSLRRQFEDLVRSETGIVFLRSGKVGFRDTHALPCTPEALGALTHNIADKFRHLCEADFKADAQRIDRSVLPKEQKVLQISESYHYYNGAANGLWHKVAALSTAITANVGMTRGMSHYKTDQPLTVKALQGMAEHIGSYHDSLVDHPRFQEHLNLAAREELGLFRMPSNKAVRAAFEQEMAFEGPNMRCDDLSRLPHSQFDAQHAVKSMVTNIDQRLTKRQQQLSEDPQMDAQTRAHIDTEIATFNGDVKAFARTAVQAVTPHTVHRVGGK